MPKIGTPSPLKHYRFASGLSLIILLAAVIFVGLHAWLPVVTLALIEITFSFENAVLNSQVLSTMNQLWRNLFLTVGILIAVFGVRLLLPLIMVAVTTGGSLSSIFHLAINHPDQYTALLHRAYPLIAAAGVTFLILVSTNFFSRPKSIIWIKPLEEPLQSLNRPWLLTLLSGAVTFLLLGVIGRDNFWRIEFAGLVGAALYVGLNSANLFIKKGSNGRHASWVNFIYLEVLDASFSVDGVIAAFAITKDVILIAAGLGIGALYVRSMTVHLLERGTLTEYRYLIHGAHYAIGVLAMILLISIRFEVPNIIASLTGLSLVLLALESSRRHNRRQQSKL